MLECSGLCPHNHSGLHFRSKDHLNSLDSMENSKLSYYTSPMLTNFLSILNSVCYRDGVREGLSYLLLDIQAAPHAQCLGRSDFLPGS